MPVLLLCRMYEASLEPSCIVQSPAQVWTFHNARSTQSHFAHHRSPLGSHLPHYQGAPWPASCSHHIYQLHGLLRAPTSALPALRTENQLLANLLGAAYRAPLSIKQCAPHTMYRAHCDGLTIVQRIAALATTCAIERWNSSCVILSGFAHPDASSKYPSWSNQTPRESSKYYKQMARGLVGNCIPKPTHRRPYISLSYSIASRLSFAARRGRLLFAGIVCVLALILATRYSISYMSASSVQKSSRNETWPSQADIDLSTCTLTYMLLLYVQNCANSVVN